MVGCFFFSMASRSVNSTGRQRGRAIRVLAGQLTTTMWSFPTHGRKRRPTRHCGSTVTSRRTFVRSSGSRVTRAVLGNSTLGCQTGTTTSGRNPSVCLTLAYCRRTSSTLARHYLANNAFWTMKFCCAQHVSKYVRIYLHGAVKKVDNAPWLDCPNKDVFSDRLNWEYDKSDMIACLVVSKCVEDFCPIV